MFDWPAFFETNGIPSTRRAHNLTKGNLGTYCPLCNWPEKNDPESWRLGISPQGRGWSCWSNAEHRGIRPARLIQAFLNCSWKEALRLAGDDSPAMPTGDDRSFGALIGGLLSSVPILKKNKVEKLQFPTSMPALRGAGTARVLCAKYFFTRGYNSYEVEKVIQLYGLRFPLAGPFRYRVVFPVEHPEGLMSWTGRAVDKSNELRYRALSADPEKAAKDNLPVARDTIHNVLWNAKSAFEDPRKTLVVCEGPFDAMRVDYYGQRYDSYDARAVCLFGKSMSDRQAELIADIAPLYKRRILMLDPDAIFDAQRMRDRLDFLHFEQVRLPNGIKDPAELNFVTLRDLLTR